MNNKEEIQDEEFVDEELEDGNIITFRELVERRSFSLIPLDGKKPVEKDWTKWCRKKRKFKVSDFERRNAGVCCGPASGVIVLDVDDRKAFMALKNALGLRVVKTFKVKTGGGGIHYYYRYPADGNKWGNKSLKHPIFKKHGIFDIKGTGGCVVAPGGFHPDTGKEYEIVDDRPIAKCPKWLLQYVKDGKMDIRPLLIAPLPKGLDAKFIKSLPVSKKVKTEITKEFPVGQRSEPQFRVMKSLFEAGCDEKTVRYIHDHYPIGNKCQEMGKKWRDEEIKRAHSKMDKGPEKGNASDGSESKVDKFLNHFDSSVIGSSDFINMKIEKPKMIMDPWLFEGSVTLIYGPSGIGKSATVQSIAVMETTFRKKGGEPPCLGLWVSKKGLPTLIVDAETHESHLQDRLKNLRLPLGKESLKNPLGIYTASSAIKNTGLQMNLANEEWREALFQFLMKSKYRLMILDNLVSFTTGLDENRKQDWDPIKEWLMRLKHNGISVIIVDHVGKNKKGPRGTSSKENTVDITIGFSVPENYDASQGAFFTVTPEKTRALPPSDKLKPFTLKLVPHKGGGLTWETGNPKAKPENDQIIALLLDGKLKQKEIAKKVGVSAMTVTNIKKDAIRRKLMDNKKNPTEAGKKILEEKKFDLAKIYAEEEE